MFRREMVRDRGAGNIQSRREALATRRDNVRDKILSNLRKMPEVSSTKKAMDSRSTHKKALPKPKETPDQRKVRLERYRNLKQVLTLEQKTARLKTPAFKVGLARATPLKENKSATGGLSKRALNFQAHDAVDSHGRNASAATRTPTARVALEARFNRTALKNQIGPRSGLDKVNSDKNKTPSKTGSVSSLNRTPLRTAPPTLTASRTAMAATRATPSAGVQRPPKTTPLKSAGKSTVIVPKSAQKMTPSIAVSKTTTPLKLTGKTPTAYKASSKTTPLKSGPPVVSSSLQSRAPGDISTNKLVQKLTTPSKAGSRYTSQQTTPQPLSNTTVHGLSTSAAASTRAAAATATQLKTTPSRTIARVVSTRTTPQSASSKGASTVSKRVATAVDPRTTPSRATARPNAQQAATKQTTSLVNQKATRSPMAAYSKAKPSMDAPPPAKTPLRGQCGESNSTRSNSLRMRNAAAALKKTRAVIVKRLSMTSTSRHVPGVKSRRDKATVSALKSNPKTTNRGAVAAASTLRTRVSLKRTGTALNRSQVVSNQPTPKVGRGAGVTFSPKPSLASRPKPPKPAGSISLRSRAVTRQQNTLANRTENQQTTQSRSEAEIARKWAELLAHIKAQQESS